MKGFAHIALFIYIMYSVHNSIIIMVINIITVICVLKSCEWLFRNCAQKLGSWAGEWKKVADACKIKTIFCLTNLLSMDMIPGCVENFYIWLQEFPVVKLASHWM